MPRLNVSNCKAAKYEGDGKSRWVMWDDELRGFGLRVYPSGRKAFVLSYRFAGRKRLYTMGNFGLWTPDAARKEARRLLVLVEQGKDPKDFRDQASLKKATFADLAQEYTERHIPKKRSGAEDLRRLERLVPSSWNSRELESFSRVEITRVHDSVGTDQGPYAANRLLAMLRAMFNLAVEWGLLPEGHPNPCRKVKMSPERQRERFVTPEELPRIWGSIGQERNPYWRAFFTLNLLLGARRGELLSMRWEDIDFEAKTWRIPETKAGGQHILPLPGAAVEILQSLPSLEGNPYVFPSHGKTGHLVEPKTAWSRICERAGVTGVRIHDLRRTVGSWLAAQGESLPMIGKVLNHSQPSTTAIYARLHLDPVRAAMERNAEHMLAIVNGKKT